MRLFWVIPHIGGGRIGFGESRGSVKVQSCTVRKKVKVNILNQIFFGVLASELFVWLRESNCGIAFCVE